MRIKSGKELSQLEIIKRLNLMGVKYDSSIIGKKYFIDLYNKEVQSLSNQQKIKNELEKDRIYLEYLTSNLRKTKETSFEYSIRNNYVIKTDKDRKCFLPDFNSKLYNNILLCYNTFHFYENRKKDIRKKMAFPISAFKKFTNAFIFPKVNSAFNSFLNYFDGLDLSNFQYLKIIIFICLIIILLFSFIRIKKGKNKIKRNTNFLFN